MLKDKKNILLFIIYPILFFGIIIYNALSKNCSEIVFVDNIQVFERFQMSIDMKKIGENELNLRKKTVDSLYKLLNNPAYTQVKDNIMKEFIFEKENLENFTGKFAEEESLKIWTRINAYTKEFSNEKGYKIVLGKQANENILYGSVEKDISNELIEYMNNKYEGNK
ncbi:Outer membrane protein (OmpH-like) [compost metagenome]